MSNNYSWTAIMDGKETLCTMGISGPAPNEPKVRIPCYPISSKTNIEPSEHAKFMNDCADRQQAALDHPLVKSAFQFIRRSEVTDSRLSWLCHALSRAGLEGTNIFYIHDPLWQPLLAPPSYARCRCCAIPMTLGMAAKHLKIAQRWLETGIKPSDEELCIKPPRYDDGRLVRLSTQWIGKLRKLAKKTATQLPDAHRN